MNQTMLHEMTTTDHLILGHLENHRGRPNAIPRVMLAGLVRIPTRVLEKQIKALVETHGYLIGSATNKKHKGQAVPSGYYIPTDPDEVDMVVAQLKSRAMSLLVRISKIKKIAVEEVMGQMRLGDK